MRSCLTVSIVSRCYLKDAQTRRTQLLAAEGLGVRVEAEENSLVDEGVLLLGPGALLDLLAGGADDRLDLVAVDEASDVGVANLSGGEAEDGK